jgi:hypothetical protein
MNFVIASATKQSFGVLGMEFEHKKVFRTIIQPFYRILSLYKKVFFTSLNFL